MAELYRMSRNKTPKLRINSQEGAINESDSLWFILGNSQKQIRETKGDRIPAGNKGDRYLPIKRQLAGNPREGIYQSREDNKGNEAVRKKEKKGNFSNYSERKSCSIVLAISFISSSRREQTNR